MTADPKTVDELREALRGSTSWRLVGTRTKQGFRERPDDRSSELRLDSISGIVQHDVEDMVVTVRSGMPVRELQAALAEHGQCLPLPSVVDPSVPGLLDGIPGTVGGLCAMNLPHALYSQYGGPREWVLGLSVVRPDGRLVKCGSKVVKNVAGFDVHKLMIGARGTLGIIVEAVLRTYPIQALRPGEWRLGPARPDGPIWVQRTMRSDFDRAADAAGASLIAADPASSTLWASLGEGEGLPRWAHDWVVRSGLPVGNCVIEDAPLRRLMERAKRLFDPDARLNPGEFGFL